MTEKKSIIIDGIDVSGCIFYQANFEEDFDVKIKHFCSNWHNSCESVNNNNCYFKQLERKKQECEQLKLQLTSLSYADTICALEIDLEHKTQEYDELKNNNDILKEHSRYYKNESKRYKKEIGKLKAENEILKKKLEQIRDIAEPYKMTIKKICKNCEKYDSCHACCYKDISCYKYTSPNAKSCDEFTYLDKLIPNIISNHILQIIDGEDNEKNS